MTIASTVTKKIYDADGVTRDWPITMETSGISSSEIKVYLVDEDGVSTLVTANYDVDLTALSVEYPTVVSGLDPIASPNKILLVRELALTQPTDYKNQGDVPAETIEEGLDRLTEIAQQLQEQVNRSIKGDISGNESFDYEDFVAIKNDCDTAQAAAELAETNAETAQGLAETARDSILNDAGFIAVAADLTGANNIGTVAGISSDVSAVADNVVAIAAVNANETNINAVATNAANINTVAGDTADINTVADNIADVNTVADNIATIASKVNGDGTVNPTNLLSNGDFEAWSAGTSAAPDGWALELTPTVARDIGDVGYGSYSAKITGNGAAVEGIKFTTGTLKPSTKYTLSVRVKATAGDTASIITTGATTNLALESTSTTFETKTGTLTTDASGTAVVIKLLAKADTDIVWFDGVHLCEGESAFAFSSGNKMVQTVYTQTGAVASNNTVIPVDDTIPQQSEGTQYMSLSIKPTNKTNILKIDVVFFASIAKANNSLVVALFQDSTADALAVGTQMTNNQGYRSVYFTHYMIAGTTSETEFKVRAGTDDATLLTFNGSSGNRSFGGVLASSITITEIKP